MKTKIFIALSACVMAFAACQKENKDDNTDTGGNTTDYQPTSAGSTWQYNSSHDGVYTETATGTDTTIGGQKFFAFDNDLSGRRYINKNGGIYTSFGPVPQLDTALTLLYLKDAPAGTTWPNVGVYSGIPITLNYTIASRDGEMTVNGNNFKDVIALNFTVTTANPLTGETISLATGKQYYAKGVGAITSTLHLAVPNTTISIDDSTYLDHYQIK